MMVPPTELTKTVYKGEKICEPDSKLEVLEDGVPSELKNIVFEDEGELWKAQEEIGLSDLDIVLNSEGYAVWREMSGTIHSTAFMAIRVQFMNWEQEQSVKFFCREKANVFVSASCRRNRKRCPDFAIWGPDRLAARGCVIKDANRGEKMNPHVIFQFSWDNTLDNDKFAVDDMSMHAGTRHLAPLGRPNVIYLIKAFQRGEAVVRFDVYVVRQNQLTTEDPTMTFRVGVEDDVIEVAPGDMGLPLDSDPFLVNLAEIRAEMEPVRVVFEADN